MYIITVINSFGVPTLDGGHMQNFECDIGRPRSTAG